MNSESSSSVSLFGKSRTATAIYRDDNRSPVANNAAYESPKRTAAAIALSPVQRVCKSPFVTPNHPLYMFGRNNCNHNASEVASSLPLQKVEPSRHQNRKHSLNPMHQVSPFRKLQLSSTFDHAEGEFQQTQYQTPCDQRVNQHVQHRVIRKSASFGMERMRKMSIDPSLKQKHSIIEADFKGEDGLVRRLRRMKRRLFLEVVGTSFQPIERCHNGGYGSRVNKLSGDSSMATESTVTSSTFGSEADYCASISSITEHNQLTERKSETIFNFTPPSEHTNLV